MFALWITADILISEKLVWINNNFILMVHKIFLLFPPFYAVATNYISFYILSPSA